MKVLEPLKCLCCSTVIPAGKSVTVYANAGDKVGKEVLSKNRMYIQYGRGIHKVKRSAFRRCTLSSF